MARPLARGPYRAGWRPWQSCPGSRPPASGPCPAQSVSPLSEVPVPRPTGRTSSQVRPGQGSCSGRSPDLHASAGVSLERLPIAIHHRLPAIAAATTPVRCQATDPDGTRSPPAHGRPQAHRPAALLTWTQTAPRDALAASPSLDGDAAREVWVQPWRSRFRQLCGPALVPRRGPWAGPHNGGVDWRMAPKSRTSTPSSRPLRPAFFDPPPRPLRR